MKVLIIEKTTPMNAGGILGHYLNQEGHNVTFLTHPSYINESYFPYFTKAGIFKDMRRNLMDEYYDIAIAPDSEAVRLLRPIRRREHIGKLIFWRMDYWPRYGNVFKNWIYQRRERKALEVDEVWSMASPDDPLVGESLAYADTTVRHVPYLLPYIPKLYDPRTPKAIWLGSDTDGSRHLARACAMSAKLEFVVADHSNTLTTRGAGELAHELETAAVGVFPYKPWQFSHFRYSDPGRIKWALAYGLPVITTDIAPIAKEIEEYGAGIITKYRPGDIKEAIETCKDNFTEMSENATALAEKYVISSDWIKLNGYTNGSNPD